MELVDVTKTEKTGYTTDLPPTYKVLGVTFGVQLLRTVRGTGLMSA